MRGDTRSDSTRWLARSFATATTRGHEISPRFVPFYLPALHIANLAYRKGGEGIAVYVGTCKKTPFSIFDETRRRCCRAFVLKRRFVINPFARLGVRHFRQFPTTSRCNFRCCYNISCMLFLYKSVQRARGELEFARESNVIDTSRRTKLYSASSYSISSRSSAIILAISR